MKIKESKIKKYSGETFNITKVNKVSRMTFSNGDWLENKEYYGKVFLGDWDVIEKNKEVIEYVDYLDDSINIIEADAYDYIPLKKYDLIIFDLWWKEKDVTLKIKNSLNKIYKKALTDNGKIIFPLIIK